MMALFAASDRTNRERPKTSSSQASCGITAKGNMKSICADIAAMLQISGSEIDCDYIAQWA